MLRDEAPSLEVDKNYVVIVDGDLKHGKQVAVTLLSFYRIRLFADAEEARKALAEQKPDVVIVGEHLPPDGGCAFVRTLRWDADTSAIPILLIVDRYDVQTRDTIHSCGANKWLVKPYRRSQLIRSVSRLAKRGMEKKWNDLPPLQKKVLYLTVQIFDNISVKISRDEPVAMAAIERACDPLIEAIHRNEYKAILDAVREYDDYTYVHSLRVAVLLAKFGQAIHLPTTDQRVLSIGGLLLDAGKLVIPHEFLNQPKVLTPEDFDVMKTHVEDTMRYLNLYPTISQGIVIIAGQHHERMDGSGYPQGLQGPQLNHLARIAAIFDVFCALTDRRVYKPALSPEAALEFMQHDMSDQLDGKLLGQFRDLMLDVAEEDTPPPENERGETETRRE